LSYPPKVFGALPFYINQKHCFAKRPWHCARRGCARPMVILSAPRAPGPAAEMSLSGV
jgi:hypothetical protein